MKLQKSLFLVVVIIILSALAISLTTYFILNQKNIPETQSTNSEERIELESIFREPTVEEQKVIYKNVNRMKINVPNTLESKINESEESEIKGFQ